MDRILYYIVPSSQPYTHARDNSPSRLQWPKALGPPPPRFNKTTPGLLHAVVHVRGGDKGGTRAGNIFGNPKLPSVLLLLHKRVAEVCQKTLKIWIHTDVRAKTVSGLFKISNQSEEVQSQWAKIDQDVALRPVRRHHACVETYIHEQGVNEHSHPRAPTGGRSRPTFWK